MADEPLLRGNQIQGDSLAGFRKDHVTLLFLRFNEKKIAAVKKWLLALAPRLATLNAVAQFNDAFREARRSLPLRPDTLRREEPPLAATWINVAFTAQGLEKLVGAEAIAGFETAFRIGADVRAGTIGDPTDRSDGSPSGWLVGSGSNVPDAMVNLAADDEKALKKLVTAMRAEISSTGAIKIIHTDVGNAKLAPRTGHEHFGFKDGVSQPGVRGTLDTATRPFLTPRVIADTDPLSRVFASPGMPLIQPGEFVLGYPRQHPNNPEASQAAALTRTEPPWASDGSYLVYRRLRQDVEAFERFLDHGSASLAAQGFTGIDRERFGAMCVGRWKDGTPVARSPLAPDPAIAADRRAAQSFFFAKDTRPVTWSDPSRVPDTLPPAVMDGDGQRCPLSGHVRKVNPRDEATDTGHGARTLRRRILRRGVTFGPSWGDKPKAERGLLFLCYQASITDQFEFVWRAWANATNTPRADAGIDPIIGQNGNADPAARVSFFVQGDRQAKVESPERFIISTGGAYLFAPSISAITDVLAR
ncbi:MAG TPA: Dyp-type peroxidase [Thermoanaerobaculia bacterium]|jgi:Dyp-type peroxidase family